MRSRTLSMCVCSTIILIALLCSNVQARRWKRQDRGEGNVLPAARGQKPTKTTKSRTEATEPTTTTRRTRRTTTLAPVGGLPGRVCGLYMCGLYCYFTATKRFFCDSRGACVCGDDDDTRSDWPCNWYKKGCAIYCSMKGTDDGMCNENNQCICTFGDEHYRPDNFPDNTQNY